MIEYSNNMEFEKAAIYRDKISSIKKYLKSKGHQLKCDKDIIVSVRMKEMLYYLLEKDMVVKNLSLKLFVLVVIKNW